MADNLGVSTGADATVKTTDTAGVHTPHHNVDSSALPTGAATEVTLADVKTATEAAATLLASPLAVSGPLTDTELRATAVPVSVPADPFGANADAASATGSLSAKLRGIATALGITALDLGSGTGGSRTLRFFKDTAQWVGGAGAVDAATQRVISASDDPVAAGVGATGDAAATAGSTGSLSAKLRLMTTQLASLISLWTKPLAGHYEHVAASQTDQMAGATGAAGDYLAAVIIIPTTASPGAVSIEDGSANTVIFDGGTNSVSNLVPFRVDLGLYSVTGGWEITTGANVRAIAVGSFT